MRDNICVLISHVLFKSLPLFSLSFDGVVEWHIKHDFYDEMSTKSDVVSVEALLLTTVSKRSRNAISASKQAQPDKHGQDSQR